MISIICLEVIVGFSFLETNCKMPQLTKTSVKVINQEKIFDLVKGDKSSNSKDEIIEIRMQSKKIIRLSILEILIVSLIGIWLLFQNQISFFNLVVMFCTEYN